MARLSVTEAIEDLNMQSIQAGIELTARMVRNPNARKVLTGVNAGITVGRFLWERVQTHRQRNLYTITIQEKDALFNSVQAWLFDALPYEEQRSVEVVGKTSRSGASRDYIDEVINSNESKRSDFIDVFYDGESTVDVFVKGHKVSISTDAREEQSTRHTGAKMVIKSRQILITCKSLAARDAVLEVLVNETKKSFSRRPRFYTAAKWGNFRNASEIPIRPLESVVLREGQKEKIIEQLQLFLSREETYVNLGIPWHMGLLLYGPPGTGKTSIATSIAHTLNLDVHYISLSALEDDATLLELLDEVSPRSILLLEDIDVASASNDREDDNSDTPRGVTLQGLLNGLDGIATPHGIITIMTTNHFNRLDPALIRPGRVDIREEIGYVDTKQIEALCQQFLGYVPDGIPDVSPTYKIAASDIVEVFKQNLDEFDKAGDALVTSLHKRVVIGSMLESMINVQEKAV